MPTIYYIRHGETDWNADRAVSGHAGHSAQRQRPRPGGGGRRHARPICWRAKAAIRRRWPIVASPLGRARVTMELVRGALSLPPPDYATRRSPARDHLRRLGRFYPGADAAVRRRRSMPRATPIAGTWRRCGGESYASRLPFITDWVDSVTADTVAVGHVGTCRTLLVALGIKTPAERAGRPDPAGRGLCVPRRRADDLSAAQDRLTGRVPRRVTTAPSGLLTRGQTPCPSTPSATCSGSRPSARAMGSRSAAWSMAARR